MEKNNPNYCEVCEKIVSGGRTLSHSTKKEHLKLLIAKLKASKTTA